MGVIRDHILVNAPISHVYDVTEDVERYHEFLRSVKKVTIIEDLGGGRRRTKWDAFAEVAGFKKPVRWHSQDFRDKKNWIITFRQETGDYKKYGGEWKFSEADGGKTRMDLMVDFELKGVPPLIKPVIDPLLDLLMGNNCKELLTAMKKRAETTKKV